MVPVVRETLFGVTAAVSGAYVAWTLIEQLHQHILNRPLLPGQIHLASSWPIFFIALLTCLYCRSKHYWLRTARINGCELANVHSQRDPLLGIDWTIDMMRAVSQTRVIERFSSLLAQNGNTFWFYSMGQWSVITSEPENAKAILSSQFDIWSISGLRQKSARLSLGPRAIFSVNGPEWQHSRAQIRPSFVRNQLADLECTDRHVENFLSRLPKDGTKVELQSLFYLFTMDISTDFMFGHSTNTLVNPTAESVEFTQSFEYTLSFASNMARMSWLMLLIPDKKFDDAVKKCRGFIDRYVTKALAHDKVKERPYVFMNELVDSGASHQEISDQLLSMILGGRDTSASVMSTLFWVLARRPDVAKKLREEVSQLHGRKPSWEDLKSLKYVNMVLKETLRLYPPVISNMRSATRDTILPRGGGQDGKSTLFIPKGSTVRYSIVSIHRRKDLYGSDADDFRPERWETLRTSWDYLPFSGGPRICIGQQFAMTQMAYMVTRIFQVFDRVEPRDDRPLQQVVGVTTTLKNDCWVSLLPIAKA